MSPSLKSPKLCSSSTASVSPTASSMPCILSCPERAALLRRIKEPHRWFIIPSWSSLIVPIAACIF